MNNITRNTEVAIDLKKAIIEIREESNKRFDDAIYRMKNDTTVTAADLWVNLKEMQNSSAPESALACMGILNQLKRRGQITDW